MEITGCSIEIQDGYISGSQRIVRNVFRYIGTYGLPLEVVLDKLKQHKIMIDWIDYCTDALRDGHNPNTIQARILEAVGDVYGPAYKKEINKRLGILFNGNANESA